VPASQTIIRVSRGRNVREAGTVHRVHEEVAGSVAREHAAGAVGAVRRWRETENQYACSWIAEPWHGTSPVGVLTVGSLLVSGDPGAVVAEPIAAVAGDDSLMDCGQRRRVRGARRFGAVRAGRTP
jgi:hypothetical protein